MLTPNEEEKLKLLYPPFAGVVRTFVERARVMYSYPVGVQCGLRTWENQGELYAKGRDVGGTIIDRSQVVTFAKPGESFHNFGCAVDIVTNVDPTCIKSAWNWDEKFDWQSLAILGRNEFGLEAGFFWKKQDMPHYQMTYGLALPAVQNFYTQGGFPRVWQEFDKQRGVQS